MMPLVIVNVKITKEKCGKDASKGLLKVVMMHAKVRFNNLHLSFVR